MVNFIDMLRGKETKTEYMTLVINRYDIISMLDKIKSTDKYKQIMNIINEMIIDTRTKLDLHDEYDEYRAIGID